MAKNDEIDYINKVSEVENVSVEEFNEYLIHKPFSDDRCGDYLMDVAQIFNLLPLPPAKVLDVGVGSGWTSELLAKRGYEVVGLDISPAMIDLANLRSQPNLSFSVCDYETGAIPTGFDAAVIYDSLHHSEDTFAVLHNIFKSLKDGGVLVTVEPGKGHSTTADSIAVMKKYGTTEKDMPYSLQRELMRRAGFGEVRQYLRLTQLPLGDISDEDRAVDQVRHALSLSYETVTGLTSVVVATKIPVPLSVDDSQSGKGQAILTLAAAHDEHIQRIKMPSAETARVDNEFLRMISDHFSRLETCVEHSHGKHDLLSLEIDDTKRQLFALVETRFAEIEGSLQLIANRHIPDLGPALQAMDAEQARNLRRKFRFLVGAGVVVSVGLVAVMALGFHWF